MDLSVIVPRRGVEGDAARRALIERLDATDLQWELLVVEHAPTLPTDSSDPRVRTVVPRGRGRSEGAFRRGFAESKGRWIVALDSSCDGLVDQIPAILEELRRPEEPDLVLSFESPDGARISRSWSQKVRDGACRMALRRNVGVAPLGVYGFRRDALDAAGVSKRVENPLSLLDRAFELDFDIRRVSTARKPVHRRPPISRHLRLLMTRRPALYYGTLGFLALVVGGVGGSVSGIRWAIERDVSHCGMTVGLGLVAMAGAQLALFSVLFDCHQGLKRKRITKPGR